MVIRCLMCFLFLFREWSLRSESKIDFFHHHATNTFWQMMGVDSTNKPCNTHTLFLFFGFFFFLFNSLRQWKLDCGSRKMLDEKVIGVCLFGVFDREKEKFALWAPRIAALSVMLLLLLLFLFHSLPTRCTKFGDPPFSDHERMSGGSLLTVVMH